MITAIKGTIRHCHPGFCISTVIAIPSSPSESNGGGVLLDAGPHSIDLPMWLTDNCDVATVRGVTFDKMKNFPEGNDLGPWDPDHFDVEDTAMAMITMKNGAMFYVEMAWASNMQQEAPGIIASISGNKAGADMVGPGFEEAVRCNISAGVCSHPRDRGHL